VIVGTVGSGPRHYMPGEAGGPCAPNIPDKQGAVIMAGPAPVGADHPAGEPRCPELEAIATVHGLGAGPCGVPWKGAMRPLSMSPCIGPAPVPCTLAVGLGDDGHRD